MSEAILPQAEADALRLIDRARRNVDKWGVQDQRTLGLAIAEECGEIAQAILKSRDEGGDPVRIYEEALDLGALCLQLMGTFPRSWVDSPPRGTRKGAA